MLINERAFNYYEEFLEKNLDYKKNEMLFIGQLVRLAEESDTALEGLDLAQYQAIHPAFGEDLYQVFQFERSVEARDVRGGTAPDTVRAQISQARTLLEQQRGPGKEARRSQNQKTEEDK